MTESKEHVLIVEDDMAMLFALERLFQSQGLAGLLVAHD